MPDTRPSGARGGRVLLALLLISLFLAGALARARVRPLWHDELFTWAVAQQPDARSIWTALQSGVDLNPPLYYVLAQPALHLSASERLAVRLPAVAGFALMLVAIAAFMRTRCGSAVGGATAAFIALSGVGPYAYEGRPYGLVLGAAALALWCWQQATHDERAPWQRWAATIGLSLSLAAGFASHYYAILMLVPIAVGEILRSRRGHLAPGIWVALLLPLATFAAWRPLIAVARDWSSGFWTRPAPDATIAAYRSMLTTLGGPLAAGLALLALVSALTRSGWLPPARTPRGRTGVPGHELAALAACGALPIAGVLLATFVTGAWHERYALFGVIGIAGLCLAGVHASGTLALRTVSAVLLLAFGTQSALRALEWREPPRPTAALTVLTTAAIPHVPVLASDGLTFVELAHYAPPELVARLVYGLKPPSVIARTGTDSENRALEQLAKLLPSLRLERFEPFVTRRRPFAVIGRRSWVLDELRARNLPLQLIAGEGDLQLFLVP